MKLTDVVFNVVFTLASAFALWCVVTEDPANVASMVTNHPWTFKAAMAFIIVDAVFTVWAVEVVKALFRWMREALGEDDD